MQGYHLSCVSSSKPLPHSGPLFSHLMDEVFGPVLSSVLAFSDSGSQAEPLWETGELGKAGGKAARLAGVWDAWVPFHPQGPCPCSSWPGASLFEPHQAFSYPAPIPPRPPTKPFLSGHSPFHTLPGKAWS